MYNENIWYVMDLMDDEVVVWGIRLSFLIFVYENFMYEIVVYMCF